MMKCTLYQKKEELVISNGSPCACIRPICIFITFDKEIYDFIRS